MNEWLAEMAENDREDSLFIEEVLKALKVLPVDVEVLKQNATPKLVKNLSKDPQLSETVRTLASQVVDAWTAVIRNSSALPNKPAGLPSNGTVKSGGISTNYHSPGSSSKKPKSSAPPSAGARKTGLETEENSLKRPSSSTSESKLKNSGSTTPKKIKVEDRKLSSEAEKSAANNGVTDILGAIKQGMSKTQSLSNISTNGSKSSNGSTDQKKTEDKTKTNKTTAPKIKLIEDGFFMSAVSQPVVKKKKKPVSNGGSAKNDHGSKPKVVSCGTAPASEPKRSNSLTSNETGTPNSEDSGASDAKKQEQTPQSGTPNKKGHRVMFREETNLVETKIYELDDEERLMKSTWSNLEGGSGQGKDLTKRERMLERRMRLIRGDPDEENSSNSLLGPNPPKYVLKEVDYPEDCKQRTGSKSSERKTQITREMSALARIYFGKSNIPPSPEEPEIERQQKAEPILIPYDDIEPQNMDLDDSADEDEKIFHELFPNAVQKAKEANAAQALPGPPVISSPTVSESSGSSSAASSSKANESSTAVSEPYSPSNPSANSPDDSQTTKTSQLSNEQSTPAQVQPPQQSPVAAPQNLISPQAQVSPNFGIAPPQGLLSPQPMPGFQPLPNNAAFAGPNMMMGPPPMGVPPMRPPFIAPFQINSPPPRFPMGPARPPICPNFSNGNCYNGNSCRLAHVPNSFQRFPSM